MIAAAVATDIAELDQWALDSSIVLDPMPDKPDRCVRVTVPTGLSEETRLPIGHPQVQVMVRGVRNEHRITEGYAREILDRFDCRDGVTIAEGTDDALFVIGCTAMQSDPVQLPADQAGRPRFAVNLQMTVHQPTTNRSYV